MAAGGKRRAIALYFPVRICYMFLKSKCTGESDLGLCMTSVLAKRMPLRSADFWRILRPNTFLCFRKIKMLTLGVCLLQPCLTPAAGSIFRPLSQTHIPPALMNHVKIFKGLSPQDAPSKLVQLWYKSFPTDQRGLVGMKDPTRLSNKTSNAWSCAEDQILGN